MGVLGPDPTYNFHCSLVGNCLVFVQSYLDGAIADEGLLVAEGLQLALFAAD